MKSCGYLPRAAFLLAFLLPTVQTALQPSHIAVSAFFPLFIAGLLLASLPRRGFMAAVIAYMLMAPATLGLIGYVCLNGVLPQPLVALAIMHESHGGEIAAGIHILLSMPVFCFWAGLLLALLTLAATGLWNLAPAPPRGEKRRAAILAICLLFAALSCWWPALGKAPPYLLKASDLRGADIGYPIELFLLSLQGPVSIESLITFSTAHAQAAETAQVTLPTLSVMVIGESMRADALGPQWRGRGPWSAMLDDRVHAGLAAWLPPACAGHDSTALSVPMLITGTPPDRQPEAATAPTGLSRLRAAGYDVAWLAANDQLGFAGPEVMNGNGLFWTSETKDKAMADQSLIPVAAHFIAPLTAEDYAGKPKALVLHLIGSHFPYEDKYPADMAADDPPELSAEEGEALSYGRANEMGARTLTQVAALLDGVKVPAFALYTSDHGENLLRDHNGLWRHVCARTSQAAILVPVLMMWNAAARDSGAPQRLLQKIDGAQRLAQVDIYRLWMAMSGLGDGAAITPTADPEVFGAVRLGDPFTAVSCAALAP